MYQDPALIRKHEITIRLSDPEAALVDALVNFTGEQRAVVLRELIIEQAKYVLLGDKPIGGGLAVEAPVEGLSRAA